MKTTSMRINGSQNRHQSSLTKFIKKPCLLTLHIMCTLVILTINSSSSWIIFYDLYEQVPGLVFDKISIFLIVGYIFLNVIELMLSILELFLWINIIKRRFVLWILTDCVTVLNIFLAEIPLGILNVYVCACQESTISVGFLAKGVFSVLFICFRLLICCISYIYEKSNYMYTGSINNSPKESDCLLGSEKFDEEIDENWSSLMENSIWKQSHWSLIRFLLMTGFLSLII
ncbi:unnamed protein product [Heterobilharzia americana]|nr:unnamed protein product [Heterobilharzia americana]